MILDEDDHWIWIAPGARAVFSSRELGSVRDVEHREVVAVLAGLDASRVAAVHQVHGADVWVDLGVEPGVLDSSVRWDSPEPSPIEADALVSAREGRGLAVVTADCMPIAVAWGPAIAAIHAGWRSLEAGVIEQTMRALGRVAGSAVATEQPRAVIGPALGACCMEVGEDVAALFDECSIVRADGWKRPHLDARADAERRLRDAGASVEHVDVCTKCDPRCFSHRGDDGATGRQAVVVTAAR